MVDENEKSLPPARGLQYLFISLGLGIAIAACGSVLRSEEIVWTETEITFASFGAILALFGLLLRVLPTGLSLFFGSTSVSLLVAFSIVTAMGINPYRTLRYMRLRSNPPEVGIWKFDPKFGYRHISGKRGVHNDTAYVATYTIDEEGYRITPTPVDSKGRIVFLGCSFTFGLGVADHETYPYLLAQGPWSEYKARNRAVTGWGTAHAYLSLLEELEEETLPRLVLYGFISDHKSRNYIRREWVRHLGRPWETRETRTLINDQRRHPRHEIEEGEIVYKGVVGPEDVTSDPPDLLEKERALTKKFIAEMAARCRAKNVPFLLLQLPEGPNSPETLPDYLLEVLAENEIAFLDARKAARSFLPMDGHPAADTYAAIADLVGSASVVVEMLGTDD